MHYLQAGSYLISIFFFLFLFFFWSNENKSNVIFKVLLLILFILGILLFPAEEFWGINYLLSSLSILMKVIFSFAGNVKARYKLLLILLVGIDCLFFII